MGLNQWVASARMPVALTGAGISAPSGIPTFQGNWKGRPIRDFLSREFFERHPVDFFELFADMVDWCAKEPNPAHQRLAQWGLPIITQNIDGLHHKAGKGEILELHGTLRTVHCNRCGQELPAQALAQRLRPAYAAEDRVAAGRLIRCGCGAVWDTDVVLYGDPVRHLERAFELASQCDLMLVVGSSLTTYPAASLPEVARERGARVVLINDDCVGRLSEEGEE